MIYFMVQYVEDGILQVVPNVKKRRSSFIAKYYNGRYYEVNIISRNPSRILLEDVTRNMKLNVPSIILSRCDTHEENMDPYTNDHKILFGVEMNCKQRELIENIAISSSTTIMKVPSQLDNQVTEAQLYARAEEIASDNEHVWDNASEMLTEAFKQDIIILNDAIIVPTNSADIEVTYGKVANNAKVETFTSALRNSFSEEKTSNEIPTNSVAIDLNNNEEKGKKAKQKRHCCVYCKKVLFKIHRHYTTVHKTEKALREIILLPVKSDQRKRLLDKIRKKGDYFFNTTLKNENQTDILCRDTLKNGNETLRDKNVPCPQCFGYYSKQSIRHHVKNCMPMRATEKRLNIQAECRKLLNNIHEKASEDLRTRIFPFFNDDEVSNVIGYDEAVITYGNYMCRKYTTEHHAQQIRSNLRAFGRLILALRSFNPNIRELNEVLDPIQVELIINAIDKVAVLDKSSHLYKAPATAMLLVTELKRLCKLLTMEYARKRDKEGQKKMEDLLLTFNLEFQVTVNKRGLETQKINSRRKKTILPKTEHIAEFRIYLEGRIRYYISELERCFCQKDWVYLVEYTLVHLAVFNRKRPGETQRILVDDYKNYEILNEDDVSGDTDSLSKEQIKKWARIRLTGKLGKNTALLVHRDLGFRAIDLILKYREKAGVSPSNTYLFGEPSNTLTQNTFQACQLIRKFSYESEIENPELLRTRLLRQHLATETAQSCVDERLEGRVSDFMSHKRRIHEDYYVMTQKTDDITRVSKLLENFSSVKGKRNLDSKNIKRKSQTFQPNCNKESSDDEYVPHLKNINGSNKMNRNSQIHEQNLEGALSDEDYVPDKDESTVSQPELNYILGKEQSRYSWSSSEKNTARHYFHDEIFYGDMVQKKKVKEFYESNRELYRYRTTHLIMQWVKCQRNKVLEEETGKKGKRIRWSTPEKELVRSSTERHSSEGTTPTLPECELIYEKNKSIFRNRNATSIKSFIYNEITKKKTV